MEPRPPSEMSGITSGLRRLLQNNRRTTKSTQEWRSNEPQCISGEYIVPKRLEAVLKRKWKNEYAVEVRQQNAYLALYE